MRKRILKSWAIPSVLFLATQLQLGAADIPDVLPDPDGEPADMKKPVKVFILMGQSNMLGFGKISQVKELAPSKYPYLVDDAGNWTVRKDVRNVFVMCSGNSPAKDRLNDWLTAGTGIGNGKTIGPEIGIGYHVGHVVDAPVMILKACIGNRSLGWDLLPPGTEAYEHNGNVQAGYRGTGNDPRGDTGGSMDQGWYAGCQYDGDTAACKKVLENLDRYYPGGNGYEVAGFFFWQGAKDSGNAAHRAFYEKNLVQLITSLRKDFDAPNAYFVVATMGQEKKGAQICDAQLAVDGKAGKYPEFKGNVASFYSNPVSKGGRANGHYSGNGETYMNIGVGMGKAMAKLLVDGGDRQAPRPGDGATPPKRPARRFRAGQAAVLNDMLLKALVDLADSGNLKPTQVPLSITKARVSLVSARTDGTLTFRAGNGKTVDLAASKLRSVDFANLAVLLSQLKPQSRDAMALAGVYLETLGRVELADKKYAEAGPESTAKMQAFLEQ